MLSPKRQQVIDGLFATMQETLVYFDGPRTVLSNRYAPGKWNVREILVHLSDAETVLLDRLRRIASEKEPPLQAFDQDAWAQVLCYGSRDLSVVKMQYQAARRSVLELATILPESTDDKTGIHSEVGLLTFGQVLSKVKDHNAHHLEQIRAAAEGREWRRA